MPSTSSSMPAVSTWTLLTSLLPSIPIESQLPLPTTIPGNVLSTSSLSTETNVAAQSNEVD
ncbi:UNVERIFIED_CONTAM: hypothetical protein NCL1_52102 [Trichonephila clavipes]